jgi:hypothetical protein
MKNNIVIRSASWHLIFDCLSLIFLSLKQSMVRDVVGRHWEGVSLSSSSRGRLLLLGTQGHTSRQC